MRPPTTVLAVLVAAAVVGGCRSSGEIADGTTGPQSPVVTALPVRHVSPQGIGAQFVAKCRFSHRGPNDPIVHYGMPGMSHSHDFFGNRATDAGSTAADLRAADTSCGKQADRASYWAPTLSDHGRPVTPKGVVAYYRPGVGVPADSVRPYPPGLKMVSGDATATAAQPVERAGWTCGSSFRLSPTPPASCPDTAPLHVVVTFPDCWNGTTTDSEDHRRHMAASSGGRCPTSHPVPVPQLALSITYPVTGPGHDLSLASGSIFSAHADFFNGWRPADLAREVRTCLNRGQVCGVASNRDEEPLFYAG